MTNKQSEPHIVSEPKDAYTQYRDGQFKDAEIARLNRTIDWLSKDLDTARAALDGLIPWVELAEEHVDDEDDTDTIEQALSKAREVVR